MMKPYRIRKHVDSETLHLPELREFIGQEVEITLRLASESLETLETFLGDALNRSPLTPEELAELREAAKDDPSLAAALSIAEGGGLDVETIVANRTGLSLSPLETLETFLGVYHDAPPPSPEDLERFRELARNNPLIAALYDAYEHQNIDADAIVEIRAQG